MTQAPPPPPPPPPSEPPDEAGGSSGAPPSGTGWVLGLLALGGIVGFNLFVGGETDGTADDAAEPVAEEEEQETQEEQEEEPAVVTRSTVDGVTVDVDAEHYDCALTGNFHVVNRAGTPVEVFVEVGFFDDDLLLEIDSGYWNLRTGFEGSLTGIHWPNEVYWAADDPRCGLRELRVHDRS